MTEKEFKEALARLHDRYLFESQMTSENYLQQEKAIQTAYLNTLYKKVK
tara:strand:- start:308 stop:454 length:147 start_codon:yes stop_codon:yes gene_type:complete